VRNLASIFDHSVACEALWYRNAARYAYRKTNVILTAPINAAFYMYIPTIPNLSVIEQSVAKLLQFKYCPHFGLSGSGFSQFHGLRGPIMHQAVKFQQNPIMRHLISHIWSVRHFLHHHYHHPLLLLSSTPGSKLIFSTNPFLHTP